MTNRIDRLEGRGFVERVRSDGDQRFVRVRLTPAGRDVMDETLPDHLAGEEQLLAHLSPPERRQLERLLRKLGDGVR